MKILIVTQYFWPESFKINDLATDLVNRGHEITVLTGKPNYPGGHFFDGYSLLKRGNETWNGIKIYRANHFPRGNGKTFRLFLNYFSFAFFASCKVLSIKGTFDRIFVYEPSPITVGFPAIAAKNKFSSPIYFWVQDLWPESISAAGGSNSRILLSFFNWVTKYIYKHSAKILVQSNGFIPYIVGQGVPQEKLIYYPNPTEIFYKITEKKEEYCSRLPEGFKLIFAGNIGHGQSFETLLQACKILKEDNVPVKWIILGDGRMKGWVINKISEMGLENCFFLMGSFPAREMPNFFACADALIVSLRKNPVFALTIPAKLQSYLACGKPVIGSIDGEGARIINESGSGITSKSDDPVELAASVKLLYLMDSTKLMSMGKLAREYYEREFERGVLLDKLETILLDSK